MTHRVHFPSPRALLKTKKHCPPLPVTFRAQSSSKEREEKLWSEGQCTGNYGREKRKAKKEKKELSNKTGTSWFFSLSHVDVRACVHSCL